MCYVVWLCIYDHLKSDQRKNVIVWPSHTIILCIIQVTIKLIFGKKNMGDTEGEKGRGRLGHNTHFHTSGKSNHFWSTKWLIFFPVRSPRLVLHISGSLDCDWLCSEWESHNWPWPQTVWGLSPTLSAQSPRRKDREREKKWDEEHLHNKNK